MLLDKLFQPFIQQAPIAVMARATLEYTLDPHRLDELFARSAQRQYTNELLFSSLVDLMSQVVLGQQPSVHAAYQRLREQFPVTSQSVYNKLQHVEPAVSAALVRDSAQRIRPVIDQLGARLPPLLPGYRVRFLDGNHLAATEHRLRETRALTAGPLPGLALVVLDQEHRTVTDVLLSEDGHAQERSLLDDLYPLVRPRDLWVADRNFCTLGLLFAIAQRQGFFVIRQHGKLPGKLVGQRRPCGRGDTGHLFEQQWQLGDDDGTIRTLRRITVVLDQPTRDGDTELHILTNLPAGEAAAALVADLYRQRWTIEGLFFELTQTLSCEINTLCYPKAALFAFCLGLLASNAVALLKAALRAEHGTAVVTQQLSAYYLALEIRQMYAGMMVAIPAVHWEKFRSLSPTQLAKVLRHLAGHVSLSRYRKSPRGLKKKRTKRVPHRQGNHVSVAQIIVDRCRRRP